MPPINKTPTPNAGKILQDKLDKTMENIKRGDIYFICEKCGADVQENLIDKEKSNKNWQVGKEKCPFCDFKISIKVKE